MRVLAAALCFSLLACASTPKAAPDEELPPAAPGTLTVGITASTNDGTARAQSEAFAALVGELTGQPARPAVFHDYEKLAKAVAEGTVDVAFLAPLAYVRAEGHGAVKPLLKVVRNGRASYRAVLFASSSSQLTNLQELAKASKLRAAWVDASSATGYIFPKSKLLVSGGGWELDPGECSEAELTRRFLERYGFDTSRLLLETRSRNTRENALFSREIAD
ncbi:MAG: PhnD/SsuA/transferrin family substrate-binding protein, partial [Myxococcales bacterium]